MPDGKVRPDESKEQDNPLLTPQEHAAIQAARKLRDRSDQLARQAARVTRPKELAGRFPRPPDGPR